MNQIELDSYLLTLKNGAPSMVREVLTTVCEVEDVLSNELVQAVIGAVRRSRSRAASCLSGPVGWFFQRSRSLELYDVADRLGYFRDVPLGHYLDLRVWLLAEDGQCCREIEMPAVDELYIWLAVVDQRVRSHYEFETKGYTRMDAEFYRRIKLSDFYEYPLRPAYRIIQALKNSGSKECFGQLRAIEYQFRPRLNQYLMTERETLSADKDEEDYLDKQWFLKKPNVFRFRRLLDCLSGVLGVLGRVNKNEPLINQKKAEGQAHDWS